MLQVKESRVSRLQDQATIHKPPTRLRVDREYTSIKDVNAYLVWVPPLNQFSEDFHSMVTDSKCALRLSDIAYLPIGHVPRSLAGIFHLLLDGDRKIYAEALSKAVPSFRPWPAQIEEGGV